MATKRLEYVCQSCCSRFGRWSGQCENCGEWNTLIKTDAGGGGDTITNGGIGGDLTVRGGNVFAFETLATTDKQPPRINSGIAEFDRVTGGGFVPGSVLLLGGEPGIGKSSLLLQTAVGLSQNGLSVVYISGEEAVTQVRLRAKRLGINECSLKLAAQTNVSDIIATMETDAPPDFIVIDSIQTLWLPAVDSPAGSVNQLRTSVQMLIRYAKQRASVIMLVGHVTKDGQIAGPRTVEHMVDAVLSFEGDNQHRYRLLRSIKNRFGPTDEVGVFEMTGRGLLAVDNPSKFFLDERNSVSPGSAVFASVDGSRPMLIEIQALVCQSSLATPRRAVVGWDGGRLSTLLAVLQSHCKIRLSQYDVYLNVAGGLKITEPAADLAVAAAVLSSLSNKPLPNDAVFFGEVSLSGLIRAAPQARLRLREAAKLGFAQAIMAEDAVKVREKDISVKISVIKSLSELVTYVTLDSTG